MTHVFTSKQEKLLAAIVPGVQNGTIGSDWIVSYSNEHTSIFDNIHHHDTNFHTLGWSKATRADFAKFVKHGIFIQESPTNYSLDEAALMRADQLGFDFPESQAVNQTFNFQNSSIGIANINTTLNNSSQHIQNADGLDNDFKQKFDTLIGELREALAQVPGEQEKEAAKVAKQAERLAEDVSSEDQDEVQSSLEKLTKAATNLAAVTPIVLPIAMRIVELIASLPK
jgi:hypothetical protein